MPFQPDLEYARQLDRQDALRSFRKEFIFPQHHGKDVIYFCGNSLGLQAKGVKPAIERELETWGSMAIDGFFRGDHPWLQIHAELGELMAPVVGAKPEEVIIMNTLTVNLHLMMVSFYRPTQERFKIIMEAGAFPSDQYAVETQVKFHGFDPKEAIIEVGPPPGEELIRREDILAAIQKHGSETALILFGGVNYYTGQCFDMEAITRAGHDAGAVVGFDLAHGAGNVPLQLHDWGVDFAVWCNYKYLNAGPGGPSGAFVHEKYAHRPDLPRFAGWWGHDASQRFLMRKGFVPNPGAAGWQLSTPLVLSFTPLRASLELFSRATMPALRAKSEQLTAYLEYLLEQINSSGFRFSMITPRNPSERGCQLSILTTREGKGLFDYLIRNGVILDWREHNLPGDTQEKAGVIRVAPTPMYNSFEDVWRFAELLRTYPG